MSKQENPGFTFMDVVILMVIFVALQWAAIWNFSQINARFDALEAQIEELHR